MKKTIALAAATLTMLAAFAAPAHAGWDNGRDVNGLTQNGITTNGVTSNGITTNGVTSNGITANGLGANGLGSNGLTASGLGIEPAQADSPTVITIELPSGTISR